MHPLVACLQTTATWDAVKIYGCVCDSNWVVGLLPGETQEPTFFGADCSLSTNLFVLSLTLALLNWRLILTYLAPPLAPSQSTARVEMIP